MPRPSGHRGAGADGSTIPHSQLHWAHQRGDSRNAGRAPPPRCKSTYWSHFRLLGRWLKVGACPRVGQPGQVYRHEWQPHDLALWDNRSMLHTVRPACGFEGRRVVHRISMIVHRATMGSRCGRWSAVGSGTAGGDCVSDGWKRKVGSTQPQGCSVHGPL